MRRDCVPTIFVNPAVAYELIILNGVTRLRLGISECGYHTRALERLLRNAIDGLRFWQPRRLEDRGRDIYEVGVLRSYLFLRLDNFRPMKDRAVGRTAVGREELAIGKRRIVRNGPAEWRRHVRVRSAEFVKVLELVLKCFMFLIVSPHRVEHATRSTIAA